MELSDRMKFYEQCFDPVLPLKIPLVIRVDGKAFHTLTRGLKVFDEQFSGFMTKTMLELCTEIQGCVLGYTQSDEISLLLRDDQTPNTEAWMGKRLNKITSISAAIATDEFNKAASDFLLTRTRVARFDSRAFVLPKEDVCNYFIWRQLDATRNSVFGYCLEKLGNKVGIGIAMNMLHGKSIDEQQEILFQETGLNWSNIEVWKKRGIAAVKVEKEITTDDGLIVKRNKFELDYDMPILTQDREYIEKVLV